MGASIWLNASAFVQMRFGLPWASTRVVQGILMFFRLAADFLIFYRLRRLPVRA